MKFTLTHNFPDVQRQLNGLRQDIALKATASALNKTAAQAKTAMSKEIRTEFVLPAAKVSQALRVNRAKAARGAGSMEVSLSSISKPGARSLNLAHFNAKQTAKGVSFKVRRDGPRKVIPGSFLINGGKTVMIRTGKGRLPIKALQTIEVAQMFNTKRINARVLATINAKLPAIFANEVRFFTDRFNTRGKA